MVIVTDFWVVAEFVVNGRDAFVTAGLDCRIGTHFDGGLVLCDRIGWAFGFKERRGKIYVPEGIAWVKAGGFLEAWQRILRAAKLHERFTQRLVGHYVVAGDFDGMRPEVVVAVPIADLSPGQE